MSIANYKFYLNGKVDREPTNWAAIGISSNFVITDDLNSRVAETVQPTISTLQFEFANIPAEEIIAYRKAGMTGGLGIFVGLPFRIDVSQDGQPTTTVFNGFINFKKGYKELSGGKVVCTVKELDNLDSFDDRVRVNTFAYLESIGVFKQSDYIDIPFIVQPLDSEAQLALLELTLFTFIIQGFQLAKEIQKDIATIVAIASTVVGIPGSLILAIATLVADVVFLIVLVFQIIKLLGKMILLLAPPIRYNKGAFYFTLLEKAFDFLGYKFETGIEELSTVGYMPAKGSGDFNITSGVPKIGEPGETVGKLINIVVRKHNARVGILDGTVHIRTDSDPFWEQNSTLALADVGNIDADSIDLQSEEFVPNVDEMKGTTVIGFATDPNEQYTLEDDEGIDTQVIRELISSPADAERKRMILIDGFEQIDIPMALASRKSVLSPIELIIEQLQQKLEPLLDQVNSIYGNQVGANLSNMPLQPPPAIATIIGLLASGTRYGVVKLSSKTYSVPKDVYLVDINKDDPLKRYPSYRIPANHRTLYSSRTLYEKYHISNSFANSNPDTRQRQLFESRAFPFTYSNNLKLTSNSYLTNPAGKRSKVDKANWTLDRDQADRDYWIAEKYTNNIRETIITTQ